MSVVPGETIQKDPSGEIVYTFHWDDWLAAASIASSSFTITGPDSVLTKDNESIVSGNKKTSLRLKAGTLGKKYIVTNRVVTNEAVPQTDDRSVTIWIRNQ